MPSWEEGTYFSTVKHFLENISSLVVPKHLIDDNVEKVLFTFQKLMTDQTIPTMFQQWREEIIPFVVKNISLLHHAEKEKISKVHHVFCGLHVIHNFKAYVEKATYEKEKIIKEQGKNAWWSPKYSNNTNLQSAL